MTKKHARRTHKRAPARERNEDSASTGAAARVYAAYYGGWKKVTDAYSIVYGSSRSAASTGRISETTQELAGQGYLAAEKSKKARWPRYTATLKPLYEEFKAGGVKLTNAEKKLLEKVLGCMAGTKPPHYLSQEARVQQLFIHPFALSKAEARGRKPFVPTPIKVKRALHSVVALAFFYLGNKYQDYSSAVMSSVLDNVKKNLGGGGAEQDEEKRFPLTALAVQLMVGARKELSATHATNSLLFKLVRFLYGEEASQELIERVLEEF